MKRKDWNQIGMAAAVVLAPGGFVLGVVLAARWMRGRAAAPDPPTPPDIGRDAT